MFPPGDTLAIDADSSAEHVAYAGRLLANGEGTVLLDGLLALRATRRALLCEVIDPAPSAHRCAYEYEVLVENARRMLEASSLHGRLPPLPRKWSVIEDTGAGPVEVWRAP